MPQQPDHLDVAMGFGFQATTGPNAVQITVDVEFQKVSGRVARPTRRLRCHANEPRRGQIQSVDEGFDKTNRVLRADILVE
jgi:hypothetical protein